MARKLASWIACGVGIIALVWSLTTAACARDWLEYRNERFDFSLRVPADQFVAGTARRPDLGALWVSRDRLARLVAVATPNETGGSMDSYRTFVMENAYAGAHFDYTPQRDNWFVLSGTKGDQIFYERVTFVCGGRYIYGWQLHYPVSQKRLYDQIVEEIHRSYRVGQGEDGKCD